MVERCAPGRTGPALSLPRRALLLGAALGGRDARAEGEMGWEAFARRFVTGDGRVVDTGNGNVSHTESQGWGLIFAVAHDDRAAFDRILDWTTRVLRRPDDALHAWRYVPGAVRPVADPNNATDGDLFIALALDRAAARWGRPELRERAGEIGRSILRLLVRRAHGRSWLLPGAAGFESAEGLVLNPSYHLDPALAVLARIVPSPAWAELRRDGARMLDEGRFGAWGLPPDWLLLGGDGRLRPAPGRPARFGYDAIRAPLYAAWGGLDSPLRQAAARWLAHATPPPAWVDVLDGSVAEYAAGAGMLAALSVAAGLPPPAAAAEGLDYYGAALCLLAGVVAGDVSAGRTAAGRR